MANCNGNNPALDLTPQEYFLQGSVLVEHRDTLLELLRGLCDNFEEPMHTFKDLETRYYCAIDNANMQLRVRRSLVPEGGPRVVRYVGMTERGPPTQPTAVRTSIDVVVAGDIDEFLTCAGFKKAFNFVASGYMFRKGRMKITVSRIMEVVKGEPPTYRFVTDSYLVETSVVEQGGTPSIGVEMRRFADSLKPIVDMIKP